ncbi:hypothetical protein DPMN_017326 [Dreissena polymorpha]|uniref:Uncharacterized protein n=1 Tax=Dreissena polymorpha TaxID=45954 RepID=A0A9D4NB67_DREPO|nr:hypothetical protein DPMN_017326 [Dreissena polymorpha]
MLKQPHTGTGNRNFKPVSSKESGPWSFTRDAEATDTDWFHLALRDEPEQQKTSRANGYLLAAPMLYSPWYKSSPVISLPQLERMMIKNNQGRASVTRFSLYQGVVFVPKPHRATLHGEDCHEQHIISIVNTEHNDVSTDFDESTINMLKNEQENVRSVMNRYDQTTNSLRSGTIKYDAARISTIKLRIRYGLVRVSTN